MLNWNTISDSATYLATRFDLLVLLEGSRNTPYVDSVGVPTIGIGYNLRVNLEPVLRAMVGNAHYSATLFNQLDTVIDKSWAAGANTALAAALDNVMSNWHANHDAAVPTQFRFSSDSQNRAVLSALAPKYDGYVNSWLSGIPDSEERAALFSLAWNAPSLLGPKLKAAIIAGDRAEAWYEIRYNSNGIHLAGIANRRYVEAEQFGLTDTDGTATYTEAVRIGRMMANHQQSIQSYELKYDADKAGVIKGIAAIDAIRHEIQPAVAAVLARFEIATAITIEELLVASSARPVLKGDGTTTGSSLNDNDLLLGHSGANTLSGGAGADILIGQGGQDIMAGGTGADLFVFASLGDSLPGSTRQDRITDFVHGTDRIDLSAIDGNGDAAGGDFRFVGKAVFSGMQGDLHYRHSGTYTIVEADVDGDRVADFRVVLNGHLSLTAGDFLL